MFKKIAYDTPCTVYILSIKIVETDYLIILISNIQIQQDIMIFFFGIRRKTKVPTTNNNIIVHCTDNRSDEF